LSCPRIGSLLAGPAMTIALKTHGREIPHLHIVSATFRTLDGATEALCELGDARSQGLLDLENAAALTRARSGRIAFLPSGEFPAWPGCGSGPYIRGILPLCFLSGEVQSADRAAFVTRLDDAGFEDDDLHALAEELVWGTSLLMAVIDRQRVDPVDDILNEVAVKIGWALMNATMADLVQQYAASCPWFVDAL
jgi:uncharacterized membrane protein